MLILSFCYAILLRGINTKALMYNSFSCKKAAQNFVKRLFPIVTSKYLNFLLELCFNHIVKILKHLFNFTLLFKQIDPQIRVWSSISVDKPFFLENHGDS